jgi:hypothetical protein
MGSRLPSWAARNVHDDFMQAASLAKVLPQLQPAPQKDANGIVASNLMGETILARLGLQFLLISAEEAIEY